MRFRQNHCDGNARVSPSPEIAAVRISLERLITGPPQRLPAAHSTCSTCVFQRTGSSSCLHVTGVGKIEAMHGGVLQYLRQLHKLQKEIRLRPTNSMVLSMRLPIESGKRLKRMAHRHGWTPSDASARLVEEGLRRSEFAFIDFRDSAAGRQACIQGSTLAVWEVMLLVRGYHKDVTAVAQHLRWPEVRVRAAVNYAAAFPKEIDEAISGNDATDFETLKHMLPQAVEFASGKAVRG